MVSVLKLDTYTQNQISHMVQAANFVFFFFCEYTGELCIFVLKGRTIGPITEKKEEKDTTSSWTRNEGYEAVNFYKTLLEQLAYAMLVCKS